MKLYIKNKRDNIICEANDKKNISLVYKSKYKKGDVIHLEVDTAGFYQVCLDDAVPESLVYIEKHASFKIPFGIMNRICYSPRAFKFGHHLITAKLANQDFVNSRRNLALNPLDGHNSSGMYPHASANVETRNESLFAARNAIDGIFANNKHYPYPYQSWGINKNPNAELTVEFGINVNIDEVVLTLRADYPHDSHWTQATLEFSDGSMETIKLKKLTKPQSFLISKSNVSWIKLKELIKAEDESQFPALTQLEVYGNVCK